jgi:hypothetical protein
MNIFKFFNKSDSCSCEKYLPLELSRDEIDKRIKESNKIKKHLDLKSKSSNGSLLFECRICKEYWQLNSAWNWDGKDYLFKVPCINLKEWMENPYMSPADMMIYSASIETYFEKNKLIDSDKLCKIENCNKKAILKDVLCKEHFIKNLQKFGLLPDPPSGRLFEPYSNSTISI